MAAKAKKKSSKARRVVKATVAPKQSLAEKAHAKSLPLRAVYDVAQTTNNNKRHWANADGLSPQAANTPAVRTTIRNRARYEIENNSYARGIVGTLANDTVGKGPRLQVDDSVDEAVQNEIETKVWQHFRAIKMARKLRLMRKAKVGDGESFGIIATNRAVASRVMLDLQVIECDRVADPVTDSTGNKIDGLILDDFGNVVGYRVLDEHPGGLLFSSDAETVPAANMVHWFRQDRPEQMRGVSELRSALPLFGNLRRYTLATIDAAETAADFPFVIFSDSPATDPDDVEPMDTVELERNMATTLPAGWKLGGLKAEQPTQTYQGFKREVLNEIARCVNMPYNIAAGNSSDYNFASGRLDHQTYFKAIDIERDDCALMVLDPFMAEFFAESVRVPGFFSDAARRAIRAGISWAWHWDGREHVDPLKEANAESVQLKNGTLTYRDAYGRRGKDWQKQFRQMAREQGMIHDLNLQVELIEIEDKGGTDEPNQSE